MREILESDLAKFHRSLSVRRDLALSRLGFGCRSHDTESVLTFSGGLNVWNKENFTTSLLGVSIALEHEETKCQMADRLACA
jgi:hypothetical protein